MGFCIGVLRRIKYCFCSLRKRKSCNDYYKELKARNCIKDVSEESIVYVIHRDSSMVGLFSYVTSFFGKIKEGLDRGWIPIIDMQNYLSPYLEESELGKKNAWEYYFEQPLGKRLEDIGEKDIVIESEDVWVESGPYAAIAFLENRYGERQKWSQFAHKYLRLSQDMKHHIDEEYKRLIGEKEKVLGVLCRGTDYMAMRPKDHPVQPTAEQMMDKAEKCMDEWGCSKIFLATEDKKILDMFRERFQDLLLFLERPYINENDSKGNFVTQVHFERENDKKEQGTEYLTQIAILAKCNSIIAGCCGGTLGAVLLTDGFEHEYFWDLGRY